MCVVRNPWFIENGYHIIFCVYIGLIYQVEAVEGKYALLQPPPKTVLGKGGVIGLLLCLTPPLWDTYKLFVLDSGLFVLKGISYLKGMASLLLLLFKRVGIGQKTPMLIISRPTFSRIR